MLLILFVARYFLKICLFAREFCTVTTNYMTRCPVLYWASGVERKEKALFLW